MRLIRRISQIHHASIAIPTKEYAPAYPPNSTPSTQCYTRSPHTFYCIHSCMYMLVDTRSNRNSLKGLHHESMVFTVLGGAICTYFFPRDHGDAHQRGTIPSQITIPISRLLSSQSPSARSSSIQSFSKMSKPLLLILLWTLGVSAHPALHFAGRLVAQIEESPLIQELAFSIASAGSLREETTPHTFNPSPVSSRGPISEVYRFDDKTMLENIYVRSNGQLVLTAINEPNVYLLDPSKRNSKPQLIHHFEHATSMTGVVETTSDVFVVVAGNWSVSTFQGIPGSFEVWSIDFNTSPPTVKSITKIPTAAGLNGITKCHDSKTEVLIADSDVGATWRLNTVTGENEMAFKDPLFTNCTSRSPLGLNGITMYEERLHFANSALRIYGRAPIHQNGTASGEIEIIGRAQSAATVFDDLVMDWEGNAWIATHPNAVTEITSQGKQRNFTGGEVEMYNPTSLAWGRGSLEVSKTLYVTTNGMSAHGKFVGAQVLAFDTRLI